MVSVRIRRVKMITISTNSVTVLLTVVVAILACSFTEVLSEERTVVNSGSDSLSTGDEILEALASNSIPKAFEDLGINTIQWFQQKLDHLNETDSREWSQRFFEYGGYYKPGGPVFLHIEGEGSGLSSLLELVKKGSFAQYAKEHGAYIVALEHRYYGLSHPTPDLSIENLKYLSVSQAIGDIKTFIQWLKTHKIFEKSKWVVFGSSYGGSLAKWFTQSYPNMTDILVASSAPLELKYEMPSYIEMVGRVINRTSPQCFENLMEGFQCMDNTIHGNSCGQHQHKSADLLHIFNLCGELEPNNEKDISGLFFTIFNIFNNIVVNDIPDSRIDVGLEGVCKSLNIPEDNIHSPLVRLGKVVREITEASEVSCIEYRLEKIVKYLHQTSWKGFASLSGDRQFQWQRCNELGWVKGSKEANIPFGARIATDFHAEICQRVFGLSEDIMIQKIQQANSIYKGKTIETKCGIYVNGNADPWSTLGVMSEGDAGVCNRAIIIEGGSHGKDKGNIQADISTTLSYPPDLRPAQREIGKILVTWLKARNCCEPKYIPGGRIISDRFFYPIPEKSFAMELAAHAQAHLTQKLSISSLTSSSPSLAPQSSTVAPTNIISELQLPIANSTIINQNDIETQDSKRVETRAHPNPPDLDKIDIQKGVEFKELTDFIKKHEKEFLTRNSEKSLYRVKIRRAGDKDSNGSDTFSKFGIKIRMVDVPDAKPGSDDRERIAKSLQQWSHWTDFETRKSIIPNAEPIDILHTKNSTHHHHRHSSNMRESHSARSFHDGNNQRIRHHQAHGRHSPHNSSIKSEARHPHERRLLREGSEESSTFLRRSHLHERGDGFRNSNSENPYKPVDEDRGQRGMLLLRLHNNNVRAALHTSEIDMKEDSSKRIKVKIPIKSSEEKFPNEDKSETDVGKALSSSGSSDESKVDNFNPERKRHHNGNGSRKSSNRRRSQRKKHNKDSKNEYKSVQLSATATFRERINDDDDTIPAVGSHEDGPLFLKKGKVDIATINVGEDADEIDNENSLENTNNNSTYIWKTPRFFAFGNRGTFLPRVKDDDSQEAGDDQETEASNESIALSIESDLDASKKSTENLSMEKSKEETIPEESLTNSGENGDNTEKNDDSYNKGLELFKVNQPEEDKTDLPQPLFKGTARRNKKSRKHSRTRKNSEEKDTTNNSYPALEEESNYKDENRNFQNNAEYENLPVVKVLPEPPINSHKKLKNMRNENATEIDEVKLSNLSEEDPAQQIPQEIESDDENTEYIQRRRKKTRKLSIQKSKKLQSESDVDEIEEFIAQSLRNKYPFKNFKDDNEASKNFKDNTEESLEERPARKSHTKSHKSRKNKVTFNNSEDTSEGQTSFENSKNQDIPQKTEEQEDKPLEDEELTLELSAESEENKSGAKEVYIADASSEFDVSNDDKSSNTTEDSSALLKSITAESSNEVGGEKESTEDKININESDVKGQDESNQENKTLITPQSLSAFDDEGNKNLNSSKPDTQQIFNSASLSGQESPDDKASIEDKISSFKELFNKTSTEDDIRDLIQRIRSGNDVEYRLIIKPRTMSNAEVNEGQIKKSLDDDSFKSGRFSTQLFPTLRPTLTTSTSQTPRINSVPAVEVPQDNSQSLAQNHANHSQSLKKSPVIMDSSGKRIPPRMLNWRALSQYSPNTRIVDMSIDHKPQNLALTAEDVAWVNFGVNVPAKK